MTSIKVKRINIALRPPKRIENYVDKLSCKIGIKYPSYFILDSKNFYPHITLYSPEFPEKNIKKILKSIEKIAANTFRINLQFLDVKCDEGTIVINFKVAKPIMDLHMAIVNKLNLLREGHIKEKYLTLSYQKALSKDQTFNIKKYGYWRIDKLYQPHITLIRLKDCVNTENMAKKIKWPFGEFTINKVGAFFMGEHGTCIKIIKEFSFR